VSVKKQVCGCEVTEIGWGNHSLVFCMMAIPFSPFVLNFSLSSVFFGLLVTGGAIMRAAVDF